MDQIKLLSPPPHSLDTDSAGQRLFIYGGPCHGLAVSALCGVRGLSMVRGVCVCTSVRECALLQLTASFSTMSIGHYVIVIIQHE